MIRLLKLRPNGKGRIICTLETHSIDAAPPYWALSYVWGAPDMPVVIHIESRDRTAYLPITRSCTNAFTSLISSYKDRYVWIDSICIDQTNVIEKAQQIPLMSSIYSKAELVIGHLSGETVGTEDIAVPRKLDFEQLGESHAKTDWDALVEIVNNAYWRRAWIIQEIVLAKNQLI
ncbi:heterokaryon incompatibility protein-domain-containing protein, partial [Leptodontidium sp. 2 PMI_412]